jgi:hypothetical protein
MSVLGSFITVIWVGQGGRLQKSLKPRVREAAGKVV